MVTRGAGAVAKRAFVTVLLALAAAYGVSVAVTRDSPDAALLRTYRRLLLRVHPDKGGTEEEQKKLQGAKETWERTRHNAAGGRQRKEGVKKDRERERGVRASGERVLSSWLREGNACTERRRGRQERVGRRE